jgi:hypothetical protein
MKTVLEDIYEMLEQHDERVFLDYMRENKKLLFKKEKEQMTQNQVVEKSKTNLRKAVLNKRGTKFPFLHLYYKRNSYENKNSRIKSSYRQNSII